MIKSKKDYLYYIEADRVAKALPIKRSFLLKFKRVFFPDYIWKFQKYLRKLEYYKNCKKGLFNLILIFFIKKKYDKLSYKLGYTIPINVFGPGLSIAHRGTIVINANTKIGANCRIHACVNIGTEAGFSGKAPFIGDNCYIGPGVKIYGNIKIADGIAIGANAVVNKSFDNSNMAIAGIPAKELKEFDTSEILIVATNLIDSGLYSNDLAGLSAKELKQKLKERNLLLNEN